MRLTLRRVGANLQDVARFQVLQLQGSFRRNVLEPVLRNGRARLRRVVRRGVELVCRVSEIVPERLHVREFRRFWNHLRLGEAPERELRTPRTLLLVSVGHVVVRRDFRPPRVSEVRNADVLDYRTDVAHLRLRYGDYVGRPAFRVPRQVLHRLLVPRTVHRHGSEFLHLHLVFLASDRSRGDRHVGLGEVRRRRRRQRRCGEKNRRNCLCLSHFPVHPLSVVHSVAFVPTRNRRFLLLCRFVERESFLARFARLPVSAFVSSMEASPVFGSRPHSVDEAKSFRCVKPNVEIRIRKEFFT